MDHACGTRPRLAAEAEVWNRVHAYGRTASHADEAAALLKGVALVDMTRTVLERALMPLPVPLRTLDALHLATAEYLRAGEAIELASYNVRLVAAAQALGIPTARL